MNVGFARGCEAVDNPYKDCEYFLQFFANVEKNLTACIVRIYRGKLQFAPT
ncbi:hypothetical protein X874_9640 [Mannheimia varigena USDA-ARS-USMARC-1312]|nr:hypothetical protein X874_9640 [Mannheimia varigena USDA-ARS-USMARC-1312]